MRKIPSQWVHNPNSCPQSEERFTCLLLISAAIPETWESTKPQDSLCGGNDLNMRVSLVLHPSDTSNMGDKII